MNINPNTIAQALWATRQPDDTHAPCNWVRVYTWRGERSVIVLTELETNERIERRVDGHIQMLNQTRYLVSGSIVDYEAVAAAMRTIVPRGTQSKATISPKPQPEGEVASLDKMIS